MNASETPAVLIQQASDQKDRACEGLDNIVALTEGTSFEPDAKVKDAELTALVVAFEALAEDLNSVSHPASQRAIAGLAGDMADQISECATELQAIKDEAEVEKAEKQGIFEENNDADTNSDTEGDND